MSREEIQNIILFNKPEIEVFRDDNLALCCEVDMFNNHLMYFVREYKDNTSYDYDFHFDYEAAITEFLNKINQH